jgi:hypothetical protein
MAANTYTQIVVSGGLATTPAAAMSQTATSIANISTYNSGPIAYNKMSMKTVYNGTTINYQVNAWVAYYTAS